MTQTVLLAGATGMLGSRVAHHLLRQPDARVRLLVRDAGRSKTALDPLSSAGAEIIVGDLADPASLDRATQGVDVIVAAVQGGPEVIVDGQVALATAGKRNGVRRILPSDYALDLYELRAFLRSRSRMRQHVPAATRRHRQMRRTAIALGNLEAA